MDFSINPIKKFKSTCYSQPKPRKDSLEAIGPIIVYIRSSTPKSKSFKNFLNHKNQHS